MSRFLASIKLLSRRATREGTAKVALVLLNLALALGIAWHLRGLAQDDFFITYTYARSLAQGDGLVYNPGERVFGTTEPGLALLLALAHAVTRVPIEILGSLSTAFALSAVALLVGRELAARGRAAEGVAAGFLLLTSSPIWVTQGAGWPLALVALLASAALRERSPTASGALAAAAVWLRPDAALGGLFLAGWVLWRRRPGWLTWCGMAAGGVLLGLLLAQLYFGQPLPNTWAAKATMAAAEGRGAGWDFYATLPLLLPRHLGPGWPWLLGLALLGLPPLWRATGAAGRVLIAFGVGLAAIYPLLGAPFFLWYLGPPLVLVAYAPVALLGWLLRVARERPERWQQLALATVALGLALLPAHAATTGVGFLSRFQGYRHLDTYRTVAAWLREHAAPTDRIAYVEIGVLRYKSERPVYDLLGLVSPKALPFVAQNDLPGALAASPTEWVLFHPRGRMAPIVAAPWFGQRYEEAQRFPDATSGQDAVLYRRRAGSHRSAS